jgi:RNA polymerase sigma factor (sigma-70 family)
MSFGGSVTHWLRLLQEGDRAAAQRLWERYFERLVRLARKRLQDLPRRAADEEDVAQSAFASFFKGAEQGRFPQLDNRDDLWQVLVMITARKAIDLVHHEHRQKRGGGNVSGESALMGPETSPTDVQGFEQVVGTEPTPEFAAQVAEEFQRLLGGLGDDTLRSVALRKMEGFTNEEIAAELGCGLSTVERKLRVIRSLWAEGK